MMQRSTERILTTHAGSLPRPSVLLDLFAARNHGETVDENLLLYHTVSAVAGIVRQQAELGIDVVDDGEVGKPSFLTYVADRLGGFERLDSGPQASRFAGSREYLAFPEFYSGTTPSAGGIGTSNTARWACTGPIEYLGFAAVQRDLDHLKQALTHVDVAEAFLPAIAPSDVQSWADNEYYASEDEYLAAIADALHEEYAAIVGAGFLLQVDDPQLVTQYVKNPELSVDDCRGWAERQVEVLNHALRGLPPDRVRFHTCYGINIGPRVHDMELKDVVDIILKINAGAYSFEAANPRHEHEWHVWETTRLPEGKVVIPGVITQSTVLVEHPATVADRITRYASVVGRENVIAGGDCGFATFAGSKEIHPSIVWAKLSALVEGARLASEQLWDRA